MGVGRADREGSFTCSLLLVAQRTSRALPQLGTSRVGRLCSAVTTSTRGEREYDPARHRSLGTKAAVAGHTPLHLYRNGTRNRCAPGVSRSSRCGKSISAKKTRKKKVISPLSLLEPPIRRPGTRRFGLVVCNKPSSRKRATPRRQAATQKQKRSDRENCYTAVRAIIHQATYNVLNLSKYVWVTNGISGSIKKSANLRRPRDKRIINHSTPSST